MRANFNWAYVLLILLLPLFSATQMHAQALQSAEKYFAEGSYQRAIPYYQKVLKKGFDIRAMRGLAESYRQVRDFAEAEKWYGYVVNTRYASADDYMHYGQVLMRQRRYELAKDQFVRFAKLNPQDERGPRYLEACRRYQKAVPELVRYEIANLPFNSPQSDFGAIPFRDGVLFSSARIKDKIVERRSDRDGNPFLDLWYVPRTDSTHWGEPKLLKGKFNTRFHEAAAAYDTGHGSFFFTRNNYNKGKIRSSREGMIMLKIYYAGLEEGEDWSQVKSLPFNSDEHSAGHPSLTKDGKVLFFASDMPGGYGGTDIWYSERTAAGWADAVNMGPLVNTVGDEMFPQIQPDGNLFFSSNGHGGQGGLDIYMARPTPRGWGDIRHLPAPINSSYDDLGYVLEADGRSGYFSSDRPGGEGLDDLWRFRILNPTVQGRIARNGSDAPLEDAIVTLTELESGVETRAITTAEGRFGFVLQADRRYKLRIVRDGFASQTQLLNTLDDNARLRQDLNIGLAEPALVLDGVVRDQRTGNALRGAEITLQPGGQVLSSGGGGTFNFDLEGGRTYTLEATRFGYQPTKVTFTTEDSPKTHRMRTILELKANASQMQMAGQVLDRKNQPVSDAEIFLIDLTARDEIAGRAGKNGQFTFPLKPNREYELVARHFGYRAAQKKFTSPGRRTMNVPMTVYLDLPGVGKATTLHDIYYDSGASFLRDEATKELERLYRFMVTHPQVRVEIASHTDARGSATANLRLSQQRAEVVAKYLTFLGLASDRVQPRGYGESRLKNNCGDAAKCTDAQHQENRRTEFIILRDIPASNARPSVGPALLASQEVAAPSPRRSSRDGDFPPLDIEKPACYRVQVAVHRAPRNNKIIAQLGELVEVLNVIPVDTALYRYQLGKCGTYQEIETLHALAKAQGFEEAFIVAYQEGRRVALPGEMEK